MIFVFEGPDGVGKSTLMNAVEERLSYGLAAPGRLVKTYRFPGHTKRGKQLRKLLVDRDTKLSQDESLALFLEDMDLTLQEVLKDQLTYGPELIQLFDRYDLSSYVYSILARYTGFCKATGVTPGAGDTFAELNSFGSSMGFKDLLAKDIAAIEECTKAVRPTAYITLFSSTTNNYLSDRDTEKDRYDSADSWVFHMLNYTYKYVEVIARLYLKQPYIFESSEMKRFDIDKYAGEPGEFADSVVSYIENQYLYQEPVLGISNV